jgi:DNA-binding MarR family transcriptional regulator
MKNTETSIIRDSQTPRAKLDEGGFHDLLGYQLAQASILASADFQREVGKPLGLGKVELTILHLINQNASVTASKLARALAISMPAITAWISRLEQRGLLSREQNPKDRRSQNFCVTPEGDALVSGAITSLLKAESQTLAHLSAAERAMLLELLRKVARHRSA